MTDHQSAGDRSPFPREIEGGGVVLTLTPDQLYVEFAETLTLAELDSFLAQYQLRPVPRAPGILPQRDLDEVALREQWLASAAGETTPHLIGEIRADDRVRTASPVYHRADLVPAVTGHGLADRLLVRFTPHASNEEISTLIEASDTEVVTSLPDRQEGPLYQLRLRDPKRPQDVFAVVAGFARSPLVRYAGPDWIQLHSPFYTTKPDDTHFDQQWNLTQIAAPSGWDISQGDHRVVIAIIDTGCALNQPDLVAKYVPVADRRDVIRQTNTPNDPVGHGTCCAGIAAAQTDNALGVAGIAWNCSIMPIQFTDTSDFASVSEMDIVQAINWAWTHGADVISMSWHWSAAHSNVDIELNNAHAADVVLVAAAGNHNAATISYPASHPRVMAVGASDENDQRKRPSSPDGENWGSHYGPELSVVAPGVHCWTTDVPGDGGFNNKGGKVTIADVKYSSSGSQDGDYYSLMNGTSAATPHVAGLAALLLSLLGLTQEPSERWGS